MGTPKKYHLKISPKTKFLNLIRRLFIVTGVDKMLANKIRSGSKSKFLNGLVPPNYLYKHGSTRHFQLNGINFNLDISDTVGHSNYFAIHDDGHSRLYKLVKPGMTIYDIGANVGSTSLNFSKLVGEVGTVYSFEPDATNFAIASEHIKINAAANIRIFNTGLGDEKLQAFQYNVNEHNRGMMRILPEESAIEGVNKTAVQIDTLDNIVQQQSLNPPDLMKLDVEGFEFKVLKGASSTINRYKPILFIELDDDNLREQNSSASELVFYLENFGYKIRNAANDEALNARSNYEHSHIDILCTP